jgi:hypothetical protein
VPGHDFHGGDFLKRLLTLALLAAMIWPTTAQAYESKSDWRWSECRFQTRDGRMGFSDKEVKLTIRCAVQHWPVQGGVTKAFYIADRESGFNEFAKNPYSSAAGVYQFVSGTWNGVHDATHRWWHRWKLNHTVFDARANSLAAVRWAHLHGWDPWGG